jgi:NhaA family Na+:H+ antiporter
MTRPRPDGRPSTGTDADGRLARLVARPVQRFLRLEVGGGIALLAMTVVALVWANSPFAGGYRAVFHTDLALPFGDRRTEDLTHWVDDGLMTIFFLVVALEIKREWVAGELRDRRAAALPMVAAVGGMVVPAALYLAVTAGGPESHGWGVPIATDIAFVLGVVALLGRRVPPALQVFLLTLAIVDDIGAIAVIAVFYADSTSLGWLAAAGAVVAVVVALRWAQVVHPIAYVALGIALWLCAYRSGVHATIAGVVMGLLTPAGPFPDRRAAGTLGGSHEDRPGARTAGLGEVPSAPAEVPPTDRLIALLHPWTSYVVVPLFALANAGIEIRGDSLSGAGPVLAGVVVGLVVGKVAGITGAVWLATRTGLARLPEGVSWAQLVGAAALAGIGFTVSLFVAGLAFDASAPADDARTGILVASVLAAAAGTTILLRAGRSGPAGAARPGTENIDPGRGTTAP